MSTVQVTKDKDKPNYNPKLSDEMIEFLAKPITTPLTYMPQAYTKPKPKLERITLNGGGYIHINIDEKREATPTEVTEYLDGLNTSMNWIRAGGTMGHISSFLFVNVANTEPLNITWTLANSVSSYRIDTTKISLATKKLDTILKQTHTLKKKLKSKGQEWTKMEDVAPKWYNKISTYFANPEEHNSYVSDLARSSKCIMGEAFNGSPDWGCNSRNEPCDECSYLGTDALKLFSSFNSLNGATTRLTDSEGWNDYIARFEYHWNQKHV